jgi:hypothetical protein
MSELMNKLRDELPEEIEEEIPFMEMPEDCPLEEDNGHYRIKNDKEAEWAMRKIREANEDKEFWKAHYDQQYKSVCYTNDLTISNMESLLQTYFGTVPHKVTKTEENYSLPSGKIMMKKQDPDYDRDDEKIIEWLKKNKGEKYVKVEEKLDWAAFKKTLTVVGEACADGDGQLIPGLKAVERDDVFKVQLKKEGAK